MLCLKRKCKHLRFGKLGIVCWLLVLMASRASVYTVETNRCQGRTATQEARSRTWRSNVNSMQHDPGRCSSVTVLGMRAKAEKVMPFKANRIFRLNSQSPEPLLSCHGLRDGKQTQCSSFSSPFTPTQARNLWLACGSYQACQTLVWPHQGNWRGDYNPVIYRLLFNLIIYMVCESCYKYSNGPWQEKGSPVLF